MSRNLLSNASMGTKLFLFGVTLAAVGLAAFGAVQYNNSKRALEVQAFNQLTAVRELKAQQIEAYFQLISEQIQSEARRQEIIKAMERFSAAFREIESSDDARNAARLGAEKLEDYYREEFLPRLIVKQAGEDADNETFLPSNQAARYLQLKYIAENTFETGSKQLLSVLYDGTDYASAHAEYHPHFRDFLERYGFYDIFLVEPENGAIVYSVFKEVDYGTSLLHGPYKDSNFATAFKRAKEFGELATSGVHQSVAASLATTSLEDFQPYVPSYNAPASFMSAPIMKDNEFVGVLIFQMPIGRINDIMTSEGAWQEVGLGESGETYLVGSDYRMRNQSRFLIEDKPGYLKLIREVGMPKEIVDQIDRFNSSIGLQRVETEGTRAAQSGETGREIFPDYRGVPVLSSYRPIAVPGLDWVIMSEIDEAEAFAPVLILRDRLILLLAIFMVSIALISAIVAKRLTRPIIALSEKARQMAEGDLKVHIDTVGGDEIANLARSFDVMREALRELIEGLEGKVAERTKDLAASETRVRTIFDTAADGIIVIGTDGIVQEFSSSAEKIFGYRAHEVVGGKVDHLMPEHYARDHDSFMQRYLETGEKRVVGITREVVGKRNNGEEFPMGLTVGEARLEGETIFVGIVRDITDRKRAEQEMSEVYQIIEQMPMSVFVQSEDNRYKYVNLAFENFHGLNRQDVLGERVRDIFPDAGERYEGYNRDILETGIRRDAETKIQDHRGDDFYVQVSTFPIKDTEGNNVAVAGLDIDVTERRRNAKQLADNLAFISALVDAIPNPIFVKDTEARFVTFNEAYNNVFGTTASERYIGKTLLDMEHPAEEKRRFHHEEDVELIKTGGTNHSEISVTLLDGSERQMLYWARAFDLSDGTRGGLLGVVVDITHQKDLEKQLSIANKRMGDELNIGRQIQMSMIPLTFPRFPEHKDIDAWAFLRPAREVGGDFYDFFFVDETHFAFVVADVSGKGVPAALLMAVAKTLLKSHSQSTSSTARIVEMTNNELSENNKDCMFITAFFAIIDTETGEMTYTNAGHNPPYIMTPEGELKTLSDLHGPMIGAMGGLPYEEGKITLGVDDKIIVYTDGVTEAFNGKREAYGEARLEALLRRSGKFGIKYLVGEISDDVDEFAGEEEQSDDITIFALRYVAWDTRGERAIIDLHLKNDFSEIDRCLHAVDEFFEKFELPQDVCFAVSTVLDDFLNNIISYAYQDDEEHFIDVSLETDRERLIISITDDGVEFDPFNRDAVDTSGSLEDREIGGLGIHLTRNIMDDYSYQRKKGHNRTVLMKRMGG